MKKDMKKLSLWLLSLVACAGMTTAMVACSDDDDKKDDKSTTGGVDVAKDNLIAYFSFEDESNPTVGTGITIASKGAGTTFPRGRRGNAFQGSEDGTSFLVYDLAAGNKIVAAKEYSLAFWMKSPKIGGAKGIFSVNKGDYGMGNLNLLLDNSDNLEGDSLRLKSYLFNTTSEWPGHDFITTSLNAGLWYHVVALYRAETSTIEIFVNGSLKAEDTRYAGPDVDGTQPKLGPLTLDQASDKMYFGKFDPDGEPQDWKLSYPGLIDEFRIYNKALSAAEVKALYDAEVDNINE